MAGASVAGASVTGACVQVPEAEVSGSHLLAASERTSRSRGTGSEVCLSRLFLWNVSRKLSAGSVACFGGAVSRASFADNAVCVNLVTSLRCISR